MTMSAICIVIISSCRVTVAMIMIVLVVGDDDRDDNGKDNIGHLFVVKLVV